MSVELDRISIHAPRFPDECPFWPCALFSHGDEIVAALYFDDDEELGYEMDAEGVLDESPSEASGHRVGWTLHILAESSPSASDPRVLAPDVDVLGDDRSLPEIMAAAYAAVAARATPRGLSYDESRKHLIWQPA
jgi:hypothetical protein